MMGEELSIAEKRTMELAKFDKIDAEIGAMEVRLMVLSVQGPADKEGAEMCHKGRIEAKNRRIEIVKWGEDLRNDAVRWAKVVTSKINPLESRIKKIESHLQEQEDIIENEKKRIKAEAEAKEAARVQARVDRICAFGATFNGQIYTAYGLQIPVTLVKACTDEQFENFIAKIAANKDTEDARLKAEEEARKVEAERLRKVSEDQEAERKRLEAIKKEQDEAAAKIKAEQDAIEAEKKRLADAEAKRLKDIEDEKRRVEDEKRRAEELEKARKEAAEKALKDAEEKRLKDEADRIEKERLAKIAAEKKAARQPDKVKLLEYVSVLAHTAPPQLKTGEAKDILIEFEKALGALLNDLGEKAKGL